MTTQTKTAPSTWSRMTRLLGAVLLASAFMVVGSASAPAAAATFEQCEAAFNGGGQGANCQITVENFLDIGTGEASSRVTTLVCSGGANTVTTCTGTPTVETFAFLTDVVEQCNYSANLGGSTLHCSVVMINTITGAGTTSAPTVNQCNNSFDSLPLPVDSGCDPVQATTNATITQCNDSMNGGTQVSMNCTVGASTVSSAMVVSVNQCNNSANEGGALLECSTSISTVVVPAADTGGSTPTAPDELAETGAALSAPLLAVPFGALLLGALLLVAATARRRALSVDR